jgi:hypothetical protein
MKLMDILIESSIDNDPELSGYLNNLDILKYFKGDDRKLLGDMVEALRSWGRYNTIMTDLSPFLTDAKTVIEGELAKEILEYAKETQEFPVNMEEFLTTQPEEVKFLYDNGQKMRDILTRATMQIMMEKGESLENKAVNDTFNRIARRAYTFTLRGPFLKDAQSRKYPS